MKKKKKEYIRIALNLLGYPCNDVHSEIIMEAIELVEKKGGDADLKVTSKIQATIQEKFKDQQDLFPEAIIKSLNETIKRKDSEILSKREQLTDIHQMSGLLLSNPRLRPRVWRGIAGDINNRCTD